MPDVPVGRWLAHLAGATAIVDACSDPSWVSRPLAADVLAERLSYGRHGAEKLASAVLVMQPVYGRRDPSTTVGRV